VGKKKKLEMAGGSHVSRGRKKRSKGGTWFGAGAKKTGKTGQEYQTPFGKRTNCNIEENVATCWSLWLSGLMFLTGSLGAGSSVWSDKEGRVVELVGGCGTKKRNENKLEGRRNLLTTAKKKLRKGTYGRPQGRKRNNITNHGLGLYRGGGGFWVLSCAWMGGRVGLVVKGVGTFGAQWLVVLPRGYC